MIFIKRTIQLVVFLFSFLFVKGQTSLVDSIFNTDSLRRIVEFLAADSLKGRLTGSAGNLYAAFFIADEFEKAGLKPIAGNNGFFMEVKPACYNVMGTIPGNKKANEVIIFSGHYDHVGTIKTNPAPYFAGSAKVENGDEIFNGANDNASGVAAVITLAKFFKSMNNNERTLLFIAFTGEELGLIGSKYLADNCEPESIVAVINFDMIGRSEYRKAKPFVTGDKESDLLHILNRNYFNLSGRREKNFFIPDPYLSKLLFFRSDNLPFAKLGIPSHTIMVTPPDDPYYHNLNDEPRTLDYTLMKNVIHAISFGVTGMVKGIENALQDKKILSEFSIG